MFKHSRRIRRFLDLSQADVERGTGISLGRISAFENGKITLTKPERVRLENFLRCRLRIAAEVEREDSLLNGMRSPPPSC